MTNGGGYTKLIATAGRHEGVEAADLIAAMTAGGLDGEAIRNVRVLERFALLEIPADAVAAIIERVTEVQGKPRPRTDSTNVALESEPKLRRSFHVRCHDEHQPR